MINSSGLHKTKKSGLLILFFLVGLSAFGQQSVVTRDTLSTINDKVNITFTVVQELDSIAEIEINHFNLVEGDTIAVFYGQYSMEDDDPSAFQQFEIDETNNTFYIGLGLFEESDLYSVINIVKSSGLLEEFIIN